MKLEFSGTILEVRAVEDCIRATRKYTKGAFSKPAQHPVQGEAFPSRVLTEYYEVYPDTEVNWDMPAAKAWEWVWGDVAHVDVRFRYDYRADAAYMSILGHDSADSLKRGIPGFADALTILHTPVLPGEAACPYKVELMQHKGRA